MGDTSGPRLVRPQSPGKTPNKLKSKPPYHITLLGDSVLDNKPYAAAGPSVTEHLLQRIAADKKRSHWRVTNCAVDGSMAQDVIDRQIATVAADTTAIVLSVGRADGLQLLSALEKEGVNPWTLIARVGEVRRSFGERYEAVLAEVLKLGVPLVLCSLYQPCHAIQADGATGGLGARLACEIGVRALNSVILSAARRHRLPVIHLPRIFRPPEPPEPGVWGGDKVRRPHPRHLVCTWHATHEPAQTRPCRTRDRFVCV